ncbi:MAG: hypothetical protein HY717_03555 [Planctomycetes bacterium]|nr:hypothetical protein [Planctomycetota bacterium]
MAKHKRQVRPWRGLWLSAAVFWGSLAAGDVVYLKNGSRMEGEVSPGSGEGKIRVTIDQGVVIEFKKEEVEKVVPQKPPAQVVDERLAAITGEDLPALLELAVWAEERRLRTKVEAIYQRILKIDPNHPAARKGLGYTVYQNRWRRESELKAKQGLTQYDGEWVTPEEKARRALEKLRKEVADDFRGADSDNRYIQEYSIRRLLDRKLPEMEGILLEYLAHPSQAVRVVAVQALAGLREKLAAPRDGAAEHRLAQALLERTLEEENPVARNALGSALVKLRHRNFFELALKTVADSANALHRERAADGVVFVLRKDWVPEVIAALPKAPPGVAVQGNPSIRRILEKIFQQDFEYRAKDWAEWWRRNAHRYTDE